MLCNLKGTRGGKEIFPVHRHVPRLSTDRSQLLGRTGPLTRHCSEKTNNSNGFPEKSTSRNGGIVCDCTPCTSLQTTEEREKKNPAVKLCTVSETHFQTVSEATFLAFLFFAHHGCLFTLSVAHLNERSGAGGSANSHGAAVQIRLTRTEDDLVFSAKWDHSFLTVCGLSFLGRSP